MLAIVDADTDAATVRELEENRRFWLALAAVAADGVAAWACDEDDMAVIRDAEPAVWRQSVCPSAGLAG